MPWVPKVLKAPRNGTHSGAPFAMGAKGAKGAMETAPTVAPLLPWVPKVLKGATDPSTLALARFLRPILV